VSPEFCVTGILASPEFWLITCLANWNRQDATTVVPAALSGDGHMENLRALK